MILIDTNLLLYAHDATSAHHARARRWLEEVLSGGEPVRFAWTGVLAFIRISTDPRILARPFTAEEAGAAVSRWLQQPCAGMLDPGERHWEILQRLLVEGQVHGPLVTDAHLAALAIEHGAMLCTADRDFTRFSGLRTQNPLA